jgi:hypothetical protein
LENDVREVEVKMCKKRLELTFGATFEVFTVSALAIVHIVQSDLSSSPPCHDCNGVLEDETDVM